MKEQLEKFVDITGYEGLYQISNLGRVKSLEKDVELSRDGKPVVRHYEERILNPTRDACGYRNATLVKNGQRKNLQSTQTCR